MRQTLSKLGKNTQKFVQEHNDLSTKVEYLKFKSYVDERNSLRSGSGELLLLLFPLKLIYQLIYLEFRFFFYLLILRKVNCFVFVTFFLLIFHRSTISFKQRWDGIAQYIVATTKGHT